LQVHCFELVNHRAESTTGVNIKAPEQNSAECHNYNLHAHSDSALLEFILGTGHLLHTMNCHVKDYTEVDNEQHSK
jgi:hypothetical protein